jgi:hypothetical protein
MAESVYDSPESQMTDHRPQLSLTYNTISRWCFTRINVVSYIPIFSRFYWVRSANRARYESTITLAVSWMGSSEWSGRTPGKALIG